MKVRIHRGAHEIGGSCVEVATATSRIVLDVGKPLWAGWGETVELPAVPGLADANQGAVDGLILSHPHLDHYGLVEQVDSRVPLYVGEEAAALVREAAFFSKAGAELHPSGFLRDRSSFKVGDFTVTPFLVDHSAFDAYALFVEGEGRQLFYSGDIRGHGRKKSLFEGLLSHPPRPVSVLLCEGTHVRPLSAVDEPPRSEDDVELSLAKRMREASGAVFVASSAQNIDRLVTVYRACKRAGRTLVTDLYGASVAAAIGRDTIPQPGFPDYRVYVPNRQRIRVKQSGEFDRVEAVKPCRVYSEALAATPGRYTLLQPSSAVYELMRNGVMGPGAVLVWSLWPGYLRDGGGVRLKEALEAAGIPLVIDHASGHAPVGDLVRLEAALRPERVVPIHTEAAERYHEYFSNVELHSDGEWWEV